MYTQAIDISNNITDLNIFGFKIRFSEDIKNLL